MTDSLRLTLFIKGAFVQPWDKRKALDSSHQEALLKVLSQGTWQKK